ncbi:MAG: aspartate kinase [Lachnospiraceae bacterium]|nr:aspartate kinase [Lachnospiraceae bacterium]
MKENRKFSYPFVFLAGFLLYLCCVLPFFVYRGGTWFYYGDYNVQQVPFYVFCHRMVREGYLFWTPFLDLGSNIQSSFAMYLWGSPFFWITIPFPESWLPNLMVPIMALKYGTALTTSFAFLKTQTRSEEGALFGAFLYAFSGFQGTNIVFNHFHDVTAFFPLYLLSLDYQVQKKRKGPFAFMTFFMLLLNYFFFVGEVLFLILYYLLRYAPHRKIRDTILQGVQIFLTALAGGLAASVLWVQILSGMIGNNRLGNVLSGKDLFLYKELSTYPAIIKSFFMLPDLVGRGTLFTNDSIRVSSIAGYLPCFALSGVIAYFLTHKGTWKKRLLTVCAVMALIPVLNASFSGFNAAVYGRWYFMPLLIMAAVTAIAMEEGEKKALRIGMRISVLAALFFMLCTFLPEWKEGEILWLSRFDHPELLITQYLSTVLLFPVLYYFTIRYRSARKKELDKRGVVLIAACCAVTTIAALLMGTTVVSNDGKEKWKTQLLTEKPTLPDEESFVRVETDTASTNYDLVWGYPQAHSFQSTVSPSIFQFYLHALNLRRSVESSMPFDKIGGRAVISERYCLENKWVEASRNYTNEGGIRGFRRVSADAGFVIYENENYIPMGFTFETCISEEAFEALSGKTADRLLVKDIILSREDIHKYADILTEDTEKHEEVMSYRSFAEECRKRRESACQEVTFDRTGFLAKADMERENLLFFSVPYDRGFSAFVDGKKAEIVRADFGLMAVSVPAGKHEVRFTYRPFLFTEGICLSLVGLILVILLFFFDERQIRLNKQTGKWYDGKINKDTEGRVMKVVKFGGSSLADAGQFLKVLDIIRADKDRAFVVPSAPGKRFSGDTKVTDMLYRCFDLASAGEDFSEELSRIKERYDAIIEGLSLQGFTLDHEFEVIREHLASHPEKDYIASRGEYLNGRIMAECLDFTFVDAKDVIFFKEDGRLDAEKTRTVMKEELTKAGNAVIPGFYGQDTEGRIKTFSRGGSDMTGAIVAGAMSIDVYENWTDVSGFMIADPTIIENPERIETITYRELRELSYMGASVLHEESIFPVMKEGIPINIRNTNAPEDPGTWIVQSTGQKSKYTITGIAGHRGFYAVDIIKSMMNTEIGFGRRVLQAFEENGISFEHMPTGVDTMTIVVHGDEFAEKEQQVISAIHRLTMPDSIEIETDLALVAIVGRGMKRESGTAGKAFRALADAGVNIRMIDQGSSELNIIVGVEDSDFEKTIRALYDAFVTAKKAESKGE